MFMMSLIYRMSIGTPDRKRATNHSQRRLNHLVLRFRLPEFFDMKYAII